jgi:hypothetical protein
VDGKQTLKQQLPYPYDQDLSPILRRLDRRTPASRTRLANDPVTAAYLAAGMRLIERHLGPGVKRLAVDPDDQASIERPLVSFLSQRAVAAEVNNNPDPFPQMGNVPTLRCTWRSHSDFIADLLRFGLWSQYQPNHCDAKEVTELICQEIEGPSFVDAVHGVAYWDLMTLIDRPRFRLELVATATAEGDDVIQKAMAESYDAIIDMWKDICTEVLRARKLRLRAGITLEDFVGLLAAVTEGVALRALADPNAGLIDHANQRSLLGTATLALIRGCVQRSDDPDDLTLELAIHTMIYG